MHFENSAREHGVDDVRYVVPLADPLTTGQWATTDVAAWTGMSTDLVLDQIRSGELRAARFGRHHRITFPEVESRSTPRTRKLT